VRLESEPDILSYLVAVGTAAENIREQQFQGAARKTKQLAAIV